MNLGEGLIAVMERTGISGRQLSKRTGISERYIRKLKKDEVDPKITTVVKLAEGLGVSLDELSGRADARASTDLADAVADAQRLVERPAQDADPPDSPPPTAPPTSASDEQPPSPPRPPSRESGESGEEERSP